MSVERALRTLLRAGYGSADASAPPEGMKPQYTVIKLREHDHAKPFQSKLNSSGGLIDRVIEFEGSAVFIIVRRWIPIKE